MAGKADATLVAAAYRMGMANVPGDYSKIFEKQYEGLIAASKATSDAISSVTETVTGLVLEEKARDEKDSETLDQMYKDFNSQADLAATDRTTGVMKDNAAHYAANGSLSPDHNEAEFNRVSEIGDELNALIGKSFLSKEDRLRKKALLDQAQGFKNMSIQTRAQYATTSEAWSSGYVNINQTYKNDPEKMTLLGEIMDRNSDLKAKKITMFINDKNEKTYRYPSGLMGEVYAAGKLESGETPITGLSDEREFFEITEKELFAGIQYKDTKTETDADTIGTTLLTSGSKMISNVDGAKIFATEDFEIGSDAHTKTLEDYEEVYMQAQNFNDIATRKINGSVYADDIKLNTTIGAAVIEQMGLTGTFTEEELSSGGGIDPTELAQYKETEAAAHEILTNPKTASQKQIASAMMAEYRTAQLKEQFDDKRTRLTSAVKTETTADKAKRLQAYELNSIAIQTAFKAAEKEGFTLDNLQGLPIDKDKQIIEKDGKIYLIFKKSGDIVKEINPKNKKQTLSTLYNNSKIRATERNIEVTSKDLTAGSNPITDYKKRGDDWYYIKGGKDIKIESKKSIELINAKAKIAQYQ